MWKQLCNYVMGRGWKNFEFYDRKSLHCHEWTPLRSILVRAQKGKRRAIEKASTS